MKIFRVKSGIVIQHDSGYYLLQHEPWDQFINDDALFSKVTAIIAKRKVTPGCDALLEAELLPPIHSQEIWAAGVTYYRSKVGRQEESKTTGGADFYARVYEAERPEIFFKNTPHRVVGHGQQVRIRKDSTWNVPEPELTLMVTSSGKIVGYTIGNDMSSRSIEGENPLYLPQAKSYDGSASVGPCILVSENQLPPETVIGIEIVRKQKVFEGTVLVSQIKRSLEELVGFLFRESSFPNGCLFMTGTGIVPPNDFTLESKDQIIITIDPIGKLVNTVA
jgi:2-dehydro-3-deoxy-D-arabinonate dehydratase